MKSTKWTDSKAEFDNFSIISQFTIKDNVDWFLTEVILIKEVGFQSKDIENILVFFHSF